MSQRKIIRAEVNAGDFMWEVLSENLNVANISLNTGNSQPILGNV